MVKELQGRYQVTILEAGGAFKPSALLIRGLLYMSIENPAKSPSKTRPLFERFARVL